MNSLQFRAEFSSINHRGAVFKKSICYSDYVQHYYLHYITLPTFLKPHVRRPIYTYPFFSIFLGKLLRPVNKDATVTSFLAPLIRIH